MISIGVDAGGTSTRVGIVDSAGDLLHVDHTPTSTFSAPDQFVTHVVGVVNKLVEDGHHGLTDGGSIGVAVAGTLDRGRESVHRSVNLPFLEGHPLRQAIADELHTHTVLMTDAEAATWGEYSALSPRPDRFVHLRLGTGLACGVVIDHNLLRLDADRTGHLEYLVVDRGPTALPCSCGKSGCLETIASGPAIARQIEGTGPIAKSESGSTTPTLTRIVTERVANVLTIAIANLVEQFHPSVITLGGGVIEAWPQIAEATVDKHQRNQAQSSVAVVEVIRATRGDQAGVIGAARLAGVDCHALATTRGDARESGASACV